MKISSSRLAWCLAALIACVGCLSTVSAVADTFPGTPNTPECVALMACYCDVDAGSCTSLCSDNLCVDPDGNAATDCKVCGAENCNDELEACTNSSEPEPPFSCAYYFPEYLVCDAGELAQVPVYDDGDLVCSMGTIWSYCCLPDDSALLAVCIPE